jgi:5-formyltetrahydrofolate cyclo-ligase
MLHKFDNLSDIELRSINQALTIQIVKFFTSRPELLSQAGAAYLPLKKEVAVNLKEFKKIYPLQLSFPILVAEQMKFAFPGDGPLKGIWLQPPYELVLPDWFFVPGLAFSLTGARLGRGKGFYDRFFYSNKGLKIGLCWSEQILENVPSEAHDAMMDFIITENFCWNVKEQNKI